MPLCALERLGQGLGNVFPHQAQESYRQFAGEFGEQDARQFQGRGVCRSERIASEDSHTLQ